MKNIWLIIICSMLSCAFFTGCKQEEPLVEQPPGELEIVLDSIVNVSANGGHFEVSYKIKNVIDEAELRVNSEGRDWVKNITVNDSTIVFDVDPNFEDKERTCRLELIYPGIYPNPTITIKQESKEYAITLSLISAAATTITLNVIPQDKEMPYVFILGNGKYLKENNLMEDDEALWASDVETFESFAQAFGSTVNDAVKVFIYEGDLISHQIKDVEPNTEYVAYAYGFDLETMKPTTNISRLPIKTSDIQEYTLHFDFNVKVDGPNVTIDVTPQGYDGYFYYGVFWAKDVPPGTSPERLRMLCEADWENYKGLYSSFFDNTEQGLHFIFNELAYQGTAHLETELDANTEFVLWAFGLNDEALLNTAPETYYFETGSVSASDNKFTISVEDLYPRKATVNIVTTNDDSYIATLVQKGRFDGYTDEETIEYIIQNFNLNYISGSMSDVVTGLTPDTEYELLVFGCQVGEATTALERYTFTTQPNVYADLEFSLNIGNYYNGAEVAAIDPNYNSLSRSAIIHISANVDDEAVNFYFSALSPLEFPEYDYESLINGLTVEKPADKDGMYPIEFDEAYIFFGVAEDKDGNFTEIWSSEEIYISKEGCSPAEEFFERVNGNKAKRNKWRSGNIVPKGKMLSVEP